MKVIHDSQHDRFYFFCPGCQTRHAVDSSWEFNGDLDKPTFSPSIHVITYEDKTLCHSFVKDGNIQFLHDCAHAFAGQTLELPDLEGLSK